MSANRKTLVAGTAALLLLGVVAGTGPAFGLGFALPDQDAFATARGNAFVATANDPAAIFYNPAGISQLDGINVSLGGYGFRWNDFYTGGSGSEYSKAAWSAAPQVFSTYSLSNYHLSFGLGFYSPYALRSMPWPAQVGFPAILPPYVPSDQSGRIDYYTLAGMVAWQICPKLSVAAGPTLNYSSINLQDVFSIYAPLPPGVNFASSFHGDATCAGYTAGLFFQAAEDHFFGLTYRSATEMNYKGYATGDQPFFVGVERNTAASADFHFPETLAFGYSYRPSDKWNFEADVNWTDWSGLKNVPLVASPPLPSNDTLDFNWKPSWMLDFGATRYLPHGWRTSAGYTYSEKSASDADYQSWVPDSDRHIFSVGVGKQCGRFSWDAAYQLAWGPPLAIGNNAMTGVAAGKYEFLGQALTLNVGYHF
ncbi:MAG TPA: outer membrane protein transport protein [Verrucomicrobiae bacterium]|jgi:long-chain fatty acid transport protein|nr:outer membrane protein transport protein [Verrucomicrobiae bacterium]